MQTTGAVGVNGGARMFKRDRSPRVLCATDLLPSSERAVSRADAITRGLGAQLLLLHVVDAAGPARASRHRGARARFVLDARARKLARAGTGAQVWVRTGRPHQAIADVAIKWDAVLIVLGPHRRRFGDSLRGTTAERVIRIADRPVLVVNRDSAGPYEHVLVAADLSRMSIGAAHVTKELGLLEGAQASVVHALEHTRGGMSRLGSDLVVVGTSRFPLFKRVFIGSVSHEVLRGIKHDVLIISPVAARRAHWRSWVASRRLAMGAGNAAIRSTHRVLEARDTT